MSYVVGSIIFSLKNMSHIYRLVKQTFYLETSVDITAFQMWFTKWRTFFCISISICWRSAITWDENTLCTSHQVTYNTNLRHLYIYIYRYRYTQHHNLSPYVTLTICATVNCRWMHRSKLRSSSKVHQPPHPYLWIRPLGLVPLNSAYGLL